ncbi:MAG: pentapeptide repeat-containing protein [Cyanobacteria bacterium P01_A01_bin.105]
MIDKAFDLILKLTSAEERILESEGAIWLKKQLKLDPDHPLDNFDGVYTYALVEYAIDPATGQKRSRALLSFFRQGAIQDFIRHTYDQDPVPQSLVDEVAVLLKGPIGQKIAKQGADLNAEMEQFENTFTGVVRRTRKPKEVRQEKQLNRRLDQIDQQQKKNHEALQQQIQQLTEEGRNRESQGPETFTLARQIKDWFSAVEYPQGDYEKIGDGYHEWSIRVKVQTRQDGELIIVRCVDGEAQVGDIDSLLTSVEDWDADKGWLCYGQRLSKVAEKRLEDRDCRSLFSYTLDELIDQKVDFSNYLTWLEAAVKGQGIDQNYVQLACKKDDVDPTSQRKVGTSRYSLTEGGIEGFVDEWLEDEGKEHLSVLGEFGTGKTWFTLHYAWITLQKYNHAKVENDPRPRLPLVIPLRDYARALDVKNVIAGFFFSQHNINLTSKVFDQLNRMGKLLLLFDGFDEMAARVDKQAMINNFWQLARVVRPGAKAILTCRTEHFPDARQGRKLLSAQLQASTQNLTGEPPQFEVLELEKFNPEQIRRILLNKTSPVTTERILQSEKLIELAERPVMVDLSLDALPTIETLDDLRQLDMSRVYLYAVMRRLERDWQEERTFTSIADKLYFLCELSWEMLKSDQMSLHFRSFPDRLAQLFGDQVKQQNELDHWHYDMMGQAMLVRDDAGYYRPAHRSLLEFFAAYKIVASLGAMDSEFLKLACRQSHIDCDAAPQPYRWEQYFRRQCNADGTPVPIAPLAKFDALPFTEIVALVGQRKLAKAVVELASDMLDAAGMRSHLIALIQQTQGQSLKTVGYTGSNIVQLALRKDPYLLEQTDLSQTILPEVDWTGASLRWSSLHQAKLDNALFTRAMGSVWTTAFSPDGTLLAIGSYNGTLQLWDAKTYQVVMLAEAHQGAINDLAFNTEGRLLASGSDDHTIKLWSVPTHSDAPTGKRWSVPQPAELATLEGHQQGVLSIAFSPNNKTLASSSDDRTIKLWSIAQRTELATLTGHQHVVLTVAFSPDGKTLASGSVDQTIKLWSVARRRAIATFKGHSNRILSVAFSPDGKTLASGSFDQTIKLWSVAQRTEMTTLKGHHNAVLTVTFSPDGQTLASGSFDKTVKLWSMVNHTEIATLKGHENGVLAVVFSPDGELLASGNDDKTIKLWSVAKQREVGTLAGHGNGVLSVAFSPGGILLASGSSDNTVKLWSVVNRCEVATFTGHGNGVLSVAFSPDGKVLASGSSDKTIKLWSVAKHTELASLPGHENGVLSVAFSPDGKILASGSSDKTIKLWSIAKRTELASLPGHQNGVRAVAFSPNGQLLASGSADGTVKLWSVKQQAEITTLEGHTDGVLCVGFNATGTLLASGSGDKTVKLWPLEKQAKASPVVTTFRGHTNFVWSVAFSPEGDRLASAGSDQTVRLWSAASADCTAVLDHRLCAGLNIAETAGLTPAQRTSLKLLGAVEQA